MFAVVLPLIYYVAVLLLLYFAGGAGHGWGCEAAFLISCPAILVTRGIPGSVEVVLVALLLVGLQYAAIGAWVDVVRHRARRRRRSQRSREDQTQKAGGRLT